MQDLFHTHLVILRTLSVPLVFLQNVCLWRQNQSSQDVSHFRSIMTFFLLFSRSFIILINILCMLLWPLLSIELSFSDKFIVIPRYLLRDTSWFGTCFYVFTIKIDFPHVHHITFINTEYLLVWKGSYCSLCKKTTLKVVLRAFQAENASDSSLLNYWPPT